MRDPVEFTLSNELHCFKRHARISERKNSHSVSMMEKHSLQFTFSQDSLGTLLFKLSWLPYFILKGTKMSNAARMNYKERL